MAKRPIPLALEVRDLRLIQAVAEHGGLTRAGRVLNLTQSALSHRLADLEQRLGAPVFSRVGRRMVLTPAGERLRESAGEILHALSRAEEEARSVAQDREAIIRLSTECYTCYHWLPPVLREFRRSHPRVEVRVVAELTRRPVIGLLRGHLDLAVVSSDLRDRRLQSHPLFGDELVAIVGPDHPWSGREYVVAEDFATEDLLVYNVARQHNSIFSEFLYPARVTPRSVSVCDLTEAIIELVKAGLGVGVLARWAVAPHLRAGGLTAIPLTAEGLGRQWQAVTLRHKLVPKHLEAFLQVLMREVAPSGRRAPRTVLANYVSPPPPKRRSA